jgi:hypothetical protein
MLINKYVNYFHDGAIRAVQHANNVIVLFMESAQLLPEWNRDKILLSKRETIAGKLCLKEIKNISVDGAPFLRDFKVEAPYDMAGIFDFDIHSNKVKLLIWWQKHPPKPVDSDIFEYVIEAEEIYWENIPTLFDAYWE